MLLGSQVKFCSLQNISKASQQNWLAEFSETTAAYVEVKGRLALSDNL